MKNLLAIFTFLFLLADASSSQECLSGYLMDVPFLDSKLVLLGSNNPAQGWKTVQISEVEPNGYFSIDCETTAEYAYYQFRVNEKYSDSLTLRDAKENSDCAFPVFLLENHAQKNFNYDSCTSIDLVINRQAFQEWNKFLKYQARNYPSRDDLLYRKNTRNFLKDSLQILLVKLFGTKTLSRKDLLNKDIKDNPAYYQELLNELQESDIDPSYYYFLEAKVVNKENESLKKQFHYALGLNGLLLVALGGCIFYIFKNLPNRSRKSVVPLSIQEKRIKELILAGKTNKEIGSELFISVSTVKTHTSNIYQKLGVKNRRELSNLF